MMTPEWLRSACSAVERRLRGQEPTADDAVSAALQWAGLLSVLLFLIRNVFELFVVYGMYEAQHRLIAVLDGVLAVWALVEVVRIRRNSAPLLLGPLSTVLVAQVAVGCIRAVLALTAQTPDATVSRLDRPFEPGLAAIFVPVHTVVFLLIGKLLIDAFSHAERVRADQLEAQVALTKRAEADLRAQQKEVLAAHRREQASAARQRRMLKLKLESSLMASAVAHEIKLPLSTILLRTRLALDSGESGPETLEALAHDAQEVVRTIEKMNILLRSVQTEHTLVNLTEVIRTCLVESKGHFDRQGITVTASGLDRPCVIDGDDAQLRIAIANVLRNAAESLAAVAGGAAMPTIAVSLRRRKRSAVLAIGDSGPGWSGAERDGPLLATTKPSGSGLGLYVVRTVMRNHRAKIAFRDSPLGGAELRLWFPREATRAPRQSPG
jgi:signal transduction histidine kinase